MSGIYKPCLSLEIMNKSWFKQVRQLIMDQIWPFIFHILICLHFSRPVIVLSEVYFLSFKQALPRAHIAMKAGISVISEAKENQLLCSCRSYRFFCSMKLKKWTKHVFSKPDIGSTARMWFDHCADLRARVKKLQPQWRNKPVLWVQK